MSGSIRVFPSGLSLFSLPTPPLTTPLPNLTPHRTAQMPHSQYRNWRHNDGRPPIVNPSLVTTQRFEQHTPRKGPKASAIEGCDAPIPPRAHPPPPWRDAFNARLQQLTAGPFSPEPKPKPPQQYIYGQLFTGPCSTSKFPACVSDHARWRRNSNRPDSPTLGHRASSAQGPSPHRHSDPFDLDEIWHSRLAGIQSPTAKNRSPRDSIDATTVEWGPSNPGGDLTARPDSLTLGWFGTPGTSGGGQSGQSGQSSDPNTGLTLGQMVARSRQAEIPCWSRHPGSSSQVREITGTFIPPYTHGQLRTTSRPLLSLSKLSPGRREGRLRRSVFQD